MANPNFLAIRKRIREVLDNGHGLIRQVSAGRISGDYWTGATVEAARARTLVKPRFTLPFIPYTKNAFSTTEIGSLAIYDIRPTIECEYALPATAATELARDTVLAQAEQDADVFRQALGCGANMIETEAHAPTGLLDGLTFIAVERALEDWNGGRLITVHSYRGVVQLTMATS